MLAPLQLTIAPVECGSACLGGVFQSTILRVVVKIPSEVFLQLALFVSVYDGSVDRKEHVVSHRGIVILQGFSERRQLAHRQALHGEGIDATIPLGSLER